jgi:hypothetical protein
MGKCHRKCKVCGENYYGQGKYCCSIQCRNIYLKDKKLNISDNERKRRSEQMRFNFNNKKLSDSHKIKIGLASELRWKNPEYYKKMCEIHDGHIVIQKTRDKIRNSQKRRKNPWTVEYNKNRIPPSDWHHTEITKQIIRKKVSGDKNGMYGKTSANIKPVLYVNSAGMTFKFRSKWEEKFAKYLDNCNISWDYENITYKLSDGNTYTPDFLLKIVFLKLKVFLIKGQWKNLNYLRKIILN